MKFTFYAGRLPHFLDHLLPIWRALPDDYRGEMYAHGRAGRYAQDLKVGFSEGLPRRVIRDDEVIVAASYEDYRAVRPARVVLVNHGIGQTYTGGDERAANHPSYSGGRDRDRVILNLCPSERDAERCRANGQSAVAIGVPKLDPWFVHELPDYAEREEPVIAWSHHADAHVCHETRWAFPHYEKVLKELVRSDQFTILGHGHPRMESFFIPFWKSLKVEYVPRFSDILNRADLYVCDNSSTLYEFAATGRPVLVLDAPWYRRDIDHGLRFWEFADVGVRVSEPSQLDPALRLALTDPPDVANRREEIVNAVYADEQGRSLCDGRATERAVQALVRLLDALS